MRKHRPFVKRDIIWKWNSHKFSLPYLKFNFPPWRGPQRSRNDHFLVAYVHVDGNIRRWLFVLLPRFEMSFLLLFSFSSFLLSFLFIFLTVVSKSTIDSTGTTVDACTECLGFVPSRKRDVVRASTRFSSIFEFDDRDSYPRLFIATLATKTCCFFSVWLSAANYVDCTRATNRSQHRNAGRFDDR